MITIGELIALRRVELSMTQLEFAWRVGFGSRAKVQDIERDRLPLVKIDTIIRIANVLKFCPEELAVLATRNKCVPQEEA